MKNRIYYIVAMCFSLAVLACQEDDTSMGEISAPTNVQVTAEIVGQSEDFPNGNGSGIVNFSATADGEITFQYDFGDGEGDVSPNGEISHLYTQTGTFPYTVVVNAVGPGGVSSSTTINIEVYSAFSDEEAEELLGGANEGDSKIWYWAANEPVHVGLGPVEDDYGNGEFAYEAWWNAIQPFDDEKFCMYTSQFQFSRTADGLTFEQIAGLAYVPGAYSGEIGLDPEQCYDASVVPSLTGVKQVTMQPSTSKAALEGTYNEEAYRGTSFRLSDNGFMGWYVGSSLYDIIYITETELKVRIIQQGSIYPDGGYAWYATYQTQDPFTVEEDGFDELVWEDNFDTNGAPDASKWTYDLGAGGWGNGEEQTYTDNAENVIVEDGILTITAKSDDAAGYTSARLKTEDLFEFTYGRVEVRAKLPASQGTWPAIWMLGANFPEVGWPSSGEIDIMEQTGDDKDTVLGTCHWEENGVASYGLTTDVADATSEFHVYALEWDEDFIRIFVDDTQYYELATNSSMPFDNDFFMILNVAMGGTLGGTIDPNFTEDTMEVDYVRVYQ